MTAKPDTFREREEADLVWIVEQKREVNAFIEKQLERDGKVYDTILKKVVIRGK